MLNKKLLIITSAAIASATLFSNSAMAVNTVSATATAQVLQPLSIVENTAMSFGTVAGDATVGTTVVLDPALGTTSSTDGASVSANPSAPAAGSFTVSGDTTLTYSLTAIPATTLTGPGTAMTVDTFTTNGLTGSLASPETFTVGATLHINAAQTAGAYSGNYTVTVNYN